MNSLGYRNMLYGSLDNMQCLQVCKTPYSVSEQKAIITENLVRKREKNLSYLPRCVVRHLHTMLIPKPDIELLAEQALSAT